MKTRAKRQESRQSGGSPYLGELVKDSFMHIYIYTYTHTHTHTQKFKDSREEDDTQHHSVGRYAELRRR